MWLITNSRDLQAVNKCWESDTPDILPFVASLVNSSLSSGCFPSSFKKAHITPLLKKPTLDPSVIQNYRPVSLLPFLSKTLERAASNQLSAYFSENNLLDPHQSGFRPGHSTETALLSVSESLHAARAASLSSVLILLDLSAAFDTVDHSTLLSSLAATGIRGTVLDWIESYLSDRSFQVAWAGPRPHLRLPEGHTELDGQSPPEAQPGKDGANLYSCSILSPPRLFHFLRGHRSDIITLRQESRSDDGQQAVPLQQHCSSNPGMQIFPIQHPQNPPLSHHLLNPAPGPSNGSIPPGLLQLSSGWTTGICHQTPAAHSECCGSSGLQPTQTLPRNSPAHYPPLAACYSSHQIQNIGSSIPGSQGISPSIPSKDIQTLHASQIPPFCYLRTPSTSPSSHLHFQNTSPLCSGPTMVE
ncbi:uncharacterized protein LOC135239856 [Anguilla rostrata]|uniref:uncharacterized protein LOC135239856 n=1 Tax=Anguilla rostrata TaxID=7938 RepID=UPI0030D0C0F5